MSSFEHLLNSVSGVSKKERGHIVKAPFGYPGGKSKSVKNLLDYIPYMRSYVELFGGTGILLLNRKPSIVEVFNDRYSGVTDFYKCIQNKETLNRLKEKIELSIHSREFWNWCKDTWEKDLDIVDRAFKWYYMTRYSFSQIGRNFGRSIKRNNQDSGKIIDNLPMFEFINNRLKNVLIENQSYEVLMEDADTYETVFYLDPPYIGTTAGTYKHMFTLDDHKTLLKRIFDLKGFVALSGYPSDLYDSYPWTSKFKWQVREYISGNAVSEESNKPEASKSDSMTEVLWIKEAK